MRGPNQECGMNWNPWRTIRELEYRNDVLRNQLEITESTHEETLESVYTGHAKEIRNLIQRHRGDLDRAARATDELRLADAEKRNEKIEGLKQKILSLQEEDNERLGIALDRNANAEIKCRLVLNAAKEAMYALEPDLRLTGMTFEELHNEACDEHDAPHMKVEQ